MVFVSSDWTRPVSCSLSDLRSRRLLVSFIVTIKFCFYITKFIWACQLYQRNAAIHKALRTYSHLVYFQMLNPPCMHARDWEKLGASCSLIQLKSWLTWFYPITELVHKKGKTKSLTLDDASSPLFVWHVPDEWSVGCKANNPTVKEFNNHKYTLVHTKKIRERGRERILGLCRWFTSVSNCTQNCKTTSHPSHNYKLNSSCKGACVE